MKANRRRVILFAVIVTTGSVLILFDVPLIFMIPLIVAEGFIILMLLGAITISDIRSLVGKAKPQKATKKAAGEKSGIRAHLSTFVSSIRSLGTIRKERSNRERKAEDIDNLLSKTVSEKVTAGPASPDQTDDQDAFLSISDDDFDMGLLDQLGKGETPPSTSAGKGSPSPVSPEATAISSGAGKTPKGKEPEPDDLSGLENLEGLSLEGVDLGGTGGEKLQKASAAPSGSAVSEVKTGPISTNIFAVEDQTSIQEDMTAFAGGPRSDTDLLSSLASEVKAVKKEKDLSLLRELKDFKAPAAEIEQGLTELYEKLKAMPTPAKTSPKKKRKETS